MDISTVRIVSGALAAVVLAVIIYRRKANAAA